jgi:hypothetical protein
MEPKHPHKQSETKLTIQSSNRSKWSEIVGQAIQEARDKISTAENASDEESECTAQESEATMTAAYSE